MPPRYVLSIAQGTGMAQAAKNHYTDWWPEDRLIAQWARHVEKLRRQLGACARKDPPPRLIFEARDVSRLITVSDGDGFMAAGLRMRLHGIDAPEIEQVCQDEEGREWPCGKRARWRLVELLKSGRVVLLMHGVDMYGRILVTCLVNDRNVNATLVREGLAIAYRDDCYKQAERQACRERQGIWRGSFEEPESWRRVQASGPDGWKERRCATDEDERSASPVRAWGVVPAVRKGSETAARHDEGASRQANPRRKEKAAPSRSPERHVDGQTEWEQLSKALGDLLKRLGVVANSEG